VSIYKSCVAIFRQFSDLETFCNRHKSCLLAFIGDWIFWPVSGGVERAAMSRRRLCPSFSLALTCKVVGRRAPDKSNHFLAISAAFVVRAGRRRAKNESAKLESECERRQMGEKTSQLGIRIKCAERAQGKSFARRHLLPQKCI
jgi:hypothetical protein